MFDSIGTGEVDACAAVFKIYSEHDLCRELKNSKRYCRQDRNIDLSYRVTRVPKSSDHFSKNAKQQITCRLIPIYLHKSSLSLLTFVSTGRYVPVLVPRDDPRW